MSNNTVRTGYVGKSPVTIGRFTYGVENLTVREWGEGAALVVGAFCSLADKVTIFLGGNHRTDWCTTYPFGTVFQNELGGQHLVGHPATKGDVIVGNDVWIGTSATIMSGVEIGDGAIVAANACVTKDVPPYTIVGGNPARVLKERFDPTIVKLLVRLRWWDLPVETIRQLEESLCAAPDKQVLTKLCLRHRGHAIDNLS